MAGTRCRLEDAWLELTEHGELVFVPQPTPKHQFAAGQLLGQVYDQLGDAVIRSVTVLTKTTGVRVPDLVWIPKDDVQEAVAQDPMQVAPPLVVEVLSESDRWSVLAHKVQAYLETGMREVAVVQLDGSIAYYRSDGVHPESVYRLRLAV
jgi:Uma2 family endonuclease